jgi:hypothetical protein
VQDRFHLNIISQIGRKGQPDFCGGIFCIGKTLASTFRPALPFMARPLVMSANSASHHSLEFQNPREQEDCWIAVADSASHALRASSHELGVAHPHDGCFQRFHSVSVRKFLELKTLGLDM